MITKLKIKNFKRFKEVDVDLAKMVVFIGPNNSGKSTALQALALWEIGVKRWLEKRGSTQPDKRPGITINRNDIISLPVPKADLLWKDLHVRNVQRIKGKQVTSNVRIDIIVEGISNGKKWTCGLEFDYANPESFFCRPMRLGEGINDKRMPVPDEAAKMNIAYLPPMSGLAAVEPKWETGRINVLIGEGQTAQVLRNLCYQVHQSQKGSAKWDDLVQYISKLFGVTLLPPKYIVERGEITMQYREKSGVTLDLSSAGRGLQQTTLLLAHVYMNPNTVLLIDEPDAHLEILRQREIYRILSSVAEDQNSQVIAASHSEVVLNEAAGKDLVIAFVGKPHAITDKGSQLYKSLSQIGFDQYMPAEQKGWVLYLEGSTDLDILISLAEKLEHPVKDVLKNAFVYYVSNHPPKARDHFFGLREAKSDLLGIAVFDRLDKELQTNSPLVEEMWKRKEIENYLCTREVLIAFARHDLSEDDLFGRAEADYRERLMIKTMDEIEGALIKLKKPSPWSGDIKVTDDFLDPLFDEYFQRLDLPNLFRKKQYHELARFVLPESIHPDIVEKLDLIYQISQKAKKIDD